MFEAKVPLRLCCRAKGMCRLKGAWSTGAAAPNAGRRYHILGECCNPRRTPKPDARLFTTRAEKRHRSICTRTHPHLQPHTTVKFGQYWSYIIVGRYATTLTYRLLATGKLKLKLSNFAGARSSVRACLKFMTRSVLFE
jgi:hypothetical protein